MPSCSRSCASSPCCAAAPPADAPPAPCCCAFAAAAAFIAWIFCTNVSSSACSALPAGTGSAGPWKHASSACWNCPKSSLRSASSRVAMVHAAQCARCSEAHSSGQPLGGLQHDVLMSTAWLTRLVLSSFSVLFFPDNPQGLRARAQNEQRWRVQLALPQHSMSAVMWPLQLVVLAVLWLGGARAQSSSSSSPAFLENLKGMAQSFTANEDEWDSSRTAFRPFVLQRLQAQGALASPHRLPAAPCARSRAQTWPAVQHLPPACAQEHQCPPASAARLCAPVASWAPCAASCSLRSPARRSRTAT